MGERIRRVRLVSASGNDLGEQVVMIVDLLEEGRPVGHHVTFDHNGHTETTSVKKIEPPDWEMRLEIIPTLTI